MALPVFATGEPKRQYHFEWHLGTPSLTAITATITRLKNPKMLLHLAKYTPWLIDVLTPEYISQLAKKIDFPSDKIEVQDYQMSSFKFPVPVGFSQQPIKVTYLEDQLNTVYLWHIKWQNWLRPSSVYFVPISTACRNAIYVPTAHLSLTMRAKLSGTSLKANNQTFTELPTGAEIYNSLFPIDIQRDSVDKSAKGISTVTVTYARIPNVTYNTNLLSVAKSIFGF